MANPPKAPAESWISTRHLQHMIAHGEAAGVRADEIEELLQRVGLARARLHDADGMVSLATVETLLVTLEKRYADPLMGLHLAADIQPATFGAVGYICQACTTFGDVLDVLTRFNGLLSNIGRTSLVRRPGVVEVCWECLAGGESLRRQATEYVLGAFVVLARLLIPEKKDLVLAVNMAHARPASTDLARDYYAFFQSPVYFGKPVSSVMVPASLLNTRMHHGDAFVKEMLERHAASLLDQRTRQHSLPDDVRHLVARMILDGVPSKEAVAQQLGISSRSLHRHLQEAGTTYRQIVDEVRLDMACRKLQESDDSVSEIAEALGFNSHPALLRWFKQATGHTPGEYRRSFKETIA